MRALGYFKIIINLYIDYVTTSKYTGHSVGGCRVNDVGTGQHVYCLQVYIPICTPASVQLLQCTIAHSYDNAIEVQIVQFLGKTYWKNELDSHERK